LVRFELEIEQDLLNLAERSKLEPVLIFKHSTRCAISAMAWSRLGREWKDDFETPLYYLDLLRHRDISNRISEFFNIEHQSPQVLLIHQGACVYNESHSNINFREISKVIQKIRTL
jgi:bacillithiol system protein YtxJ